MQDASGKLVFANQSAARACGCATPEELLAMPVAKVFERFEMLAEDGRPLVLADLPGRQALAGVEAPETVIRVRPRDGSPETWTLVRATAIRGPDGRIEYAVNYFHDITAIKQAIAARDDFLSMASHELRSPLTAIQLLADTLALRVGRGPIETEWLSERAHTLASQIRRVASLLDALLDVNRLESGRLTLELEDLDLGALARDVAGRLREGATRAGSPLEVAGGGAVGRWDRMRLEQVVTNLVDNAIKYGGGRPIHVAVAADGAHARLSVRDQGVGIAPEDHGRIFERFERRVREGGVVGFGLGLYIVRQLVGAHGGTIAVASRPGEGSTFTVTLPRSGPPA